RSPGTDLPPADRAARDKPDAIIERIIEPVISEHERTCIRRIRKMRSRDRAEPRDAVIVDLRCCQPVYLHRLRNLRLPRGLPLLRRTSDRFPRTGLGRARGMRAKSAGSRSGPTGFQPALFVRDAERYHCPSARTKYCP